MKKLVLALILLFCVSTPCFAKWEKANTLLFILRMADRQQTLTIATEKLPEGYGRVENESDGKTTCFRYTEANPILGKHPSIEEVDRYFACLCILDLLIALYGPDWLNSIWCGLQITAEAYCVGHNYKIGIRIGGKF